MPRQSSLRSKSASPTLRVSRSELSRLGKLASTPAVRLDERLNAIERLGQINHATAVNHLVRSTRQSQWAGTQAAVKWTGIEAAVNALGASPHPSAGDALAKMAEGKRYATAMKAREALVNRGDSRGFDSIERYAIRHENFHHFVAFLSSRSDARSVQTVTRIVPHADETQRRILFQTIMDRCKDNPAFLPALLQLVAMPNFDQKYIRADFQKRLDEWRQNSATRNHAALHTFDRLNAHLYRTPEGQLFEHPDVIRRAFETFQKPAIAKRLKNTRALTLFLNQLRDAAAKNRGK